MTIRIEEGTRHRTVAPSPIRVTTGARLFVNDTATAEGISIFVPGIECHILQLCARAMKSDGIYLQANWRTVRGSVNATTTDLSKPVLHLDTASTTSAWYDAKPVTGFPPCVRNDDGLLMFDAPQMGTFRFMSTSDCETFFAITFIVSDGMLASILAWRVVKEFKIAAKYELGRYPPDNRLVAYANKIIADTKAASGGSYPERIPLRACRSERFGVPSKPGDLKEVAATL